MTLGAILAGIVLYLDYRNAPPSADQNNQQPNYEQSSQDSRAWIESVKKQAAPNPADTKRGNSPDSGERYHSALDLAAQWLSAQSADKMVYWTKWQLAIGAIGLIALAISLKFTFKATKAAVKAADSAEAQAQISREMGEAEIRAYPTIEEINGGISWTGNTIYLSFKIKNYGNTPARDLTLRVKPCFIIWGEEFLENEFGPPIFEANMASGREESFTRTIMVPKDEGDIASLISSGAVIGVYVATELSFVDVFKRKIADVLWWSVNLAEFGQTLSLRCMPDRKKD